MNPIKFKKVDRTQPNFSSALKKNVGDYFKENNISMNGDFRMVIKTIIMISIYLIPFTILLFNQISGWIALLLCVIMGIGLAGTGMSVMHDAVHGSYSKKKWINKLMGGTMYLLGSNVLNWKIQHNVLHHTYTNIYNYDEDIDSRGPIRLAEQAKLKSINKYQYIHAFFFYGLMTLSKTIGDFKQLGKYYKMGLLEGQNVKIKQVYFFMSIRKLSYLILILGLPIYFTDFLWWQVLIGFFVMHWVASVILAVIFQLAHVVEGALQPFPSHEGNMEHEFLVHQLLTTADFARNNKLLSWYIGGLNFQVIHHLFPNICHIHYRKLSFIVEKTANEFNLPYNLKPSFVAALRSHVKRLKELGGN